MVIDSAAYAAEFHEKGFAVFPHVLNDDLVNRLRTAIGDVPFSDAVRRKQNVYGVRNLLELSADVRALAAIDAVRQFVTPILGDGGFATRAVFFDKAPGANWALGWHQDSVIAVAERKDVPGFVAWGQKAGVWQVQPPAEVLFNMVAVRVHLDDCGPDNGPLRVLPGSHRHGWVEDDLDTWKRRAPEVTCIAKAGGVVVMCPLLLHASSKAISPSHRRVIHIEYANSDLPCGLSWQKRVGPTSAIG